MLPRCMFVLIRAAHQHATRAWCPAVVGFKCRADPQGHFCIGDSAPSPPATCRPLRRCPTRVRCHSAPVARRVHGRPRPDDGSGFWCEAVSSSRSLHAAPPRQSGAALLRARPTEASELLHDATQAQRSAADGGAPAAAATMDSSVRETEAVSQAGMQGQRVGQRAVLLDEHLWASERNDDARLDADGRDPATNDELRQRQASRLWACSFPV